MAEITNKPGKAGRLVRVDLTPMVDLGFLLITFFVFTTELSQRKAMSLYLPKPSNDSMHVAASGAVTLLLGDGVLGYYAGKRPMGVQYISANKPEALRSLLLALRQQLIVETGSDKRLFVSIKPTRLSCIGDVVNALDEMTICQISRYALTDAAPEEEALMQ